MLALMVFGVACSEKSVDEPDHEDLVVVSYGGAYQEAQRVAMFAPFMQQSGVDIEDRVYNGAYDTFRDSAASGNWHVVDVEGNMILQGSRDGLLAPIDYSVVPTAGLEQNAVSEYGVGVMAFSFVLAYDSEVVLKTDLDNPWKIFFDPDVVPGPRGLPDDPRKTLEIALMADGVAPENLYPLDVDRALGVLSRLRDTMESKGTPIVWWDSYSEPQTLLENDQVVLTPGLNGRIVAARNSGAQIDLVWTRGILDYDWWVVPTSSTHKEEAMQFLAYAVSAEAQAALSSAIPYSPINRDAWEIIPNSIEKDLPTSPENVTDQLWFNVEWWVDNVESVQLKWEAWRAE